jgi:hypothetical protein
MSVNRAQDDDDNIVTINHKKGTNNRKIIKIIKVTLSKLKKNRHLNK